MTNVITPETNVIRQVTMRMPLLLSYLWVTLLVGCASPLSQYDFESDIVRQRQDFKAQGASVKSARSAIENEDTINARHAVEKAPVLHAESDSSSSDLLPTIGQDSTLAEALTYAALCNRDLESAYYVWQAELEDRPQVTALPDPRLTFGHYIAEVETRVGPMRQQIQMSQTFPWFGKQESRGLAADADARAAFLRFESRKHQIFDRVRTAYYEMYYLQSSTGILEDNIELLKQFESLVQQRYQIGESQASQIIRVQIEIEKRQDELRRLQDKRHPLVAIFNAALGRPANSEAPRPLSLDARSLEASLGELQQMLPLDNPELLALQEEMNRERHASEVARKLFYPDVTLGFGYTTIGDGTNASDPEDGNDALLATVSINIPIQSDKYSAAVRQSLMRRLALASSREERLNRLMAELTTLYYEHIDAIERVSLYQDRLIPQTEESMHATLAEFEAGDATFLDLLDIERTWLEMQRLHERAITDRQLALSHLERLIGQSLPFVESDPRGTTESETHHE